MTGNSFYFSTEMCNFTDVINILNSHLSLMSMCSLLSIFYFIEEHDMPSDNTVGCYTFILPSYVILGIFI